MPDIKTKLCNTCENDKAITEYYTRGKYLFSDCKSCTYKKYGYNEKRKLYHKNRHLDKKLKECNSSKEQYEAFMIRCNKRCFICKQGFDQTIKPYVDHDHKTGNFRGLLCSSCNVLLGFAKDSTARLKRAVLYLDKFCLK